MAGNKWSEDTTIKFVREYVSHECLWDTKHLLYKNKSARLAAYRDIAKIMNLPNFGEKEIVIKIKNIRSTYCQELKKIKDSKKGSGVGSENVYVPNLKWFSILNSIRKSEDNLDNSQTETAEDTGGISFQENNCNGSTRTQNNVEEVADFQSFTETEQPRPVKKRRLQELSALLTKVKEVSLINNAPPPEEHEFDIFGRSIAAQLKMLPLDKALQAQHFIQSHLTGLRLQETLSCPSSVNNSSPNSPHEVDVKLEQMSP